MAEVVVVGAGFAGLAAARELSRLGRDVVVVEGRDRVGGRSYTGSVGGVPVDFGATFVGPTQDAVLALAAESLGAMEVCKKATIEYLQTRKQFGKVIGSFQALQHRMATVLLEVEQARSAVINAASALDGDDRIARERALSAAKYTAGKTGTLVAEESIQLHGGIGVTWELPMPHYAKRLVMIDHVLGDEDHHLQRFIALGQQ